MQTEIHQRLLEIESAYYDGASYCALCKKIVETANLISVQDERDPDREACEVFAPLLWGGASGTTIEPEAIKAALAGPDGPSCLQSWSGMGRALSAYRIAA